MPGASMRASNALPNMCCATRRTKACGPAIRRRTARRGPAWPQQPLQPVPSPLQRPWPRGRTTRMPEPAPPSPFPGLTLEPRLKLQTKRAPPKIPPQTAIFLRPNPVKTPPMARSKPARVWNCRLPTPPSRSKRPTAPYRKPPARWRLLPRPGRRSRLKRPRLKLALRKRSKPALRSSRRRPRWMKHR